MKSDVVVVVELKPTTLGRGRKARSAAATLVFAALAATACGGTIGEIVRPKEKSYADAVGQQSTGPCRDVASYAKPLIVDWQPTERGDMEIAMREGVPVVKYDCNTLEMLPDCRARGTYGFLSMTAKEQLIELKDAEEVRVNLPLNGAKLGASLERSASLNIAMMIVGKQSTTMSSVFRSELEGACDGATHFLRRATVGAFALKTAAAGSVSSAAEIFGVGAGASAGSDKKVFNKDGSIDACKAADASRDQLPRGCGALIRVELMAIRSGKPQLGGGASDDQDAAAACPKGMVSNSGKCVIVASSAAHQCKPGDLADCDKQCAAGQAGSCVELGKFLTTDKIYPGGVLKCTFVPGCMSRAKKNEQFDPKRGGEAYERACQLGEVEGYSGLAGVYRHGIGTPKDPKRAQAITRKSCLAGHANNCAAYAQAHRDKSVRAQYLAKACRGGLGYACSSLSKMYAAGEGVAKDGKRAAELLKRACEARDSGSCGQVGLSYRDGKGIKKSKDLAIFFLRRACKYSGGIRRGAYCDDLKGMGVEVVYDHALGCVKGC